MVRTDEEVATVATETKKAGQRWKTKSTTSSYFFSSSKPSPTSPEPPPEGDSSQSSPCNSCTGNIVHSTDIMNDAYYGTRGTDVEAGGADNTEVISINDHNFNKQLSIRSIRSTMKRQMSARSIGSNTSNNFTNNINSIINSITNTSSGNNDTDKSSRRKGLIAKRRTLFLRSILIISLLVAVSVCASLSYVKLRDTEELVGRHTYESIAASALLGAQSLTKRKVQGSEVMATLLSHTFADREDWPFISMDGYIPIAQKVADLSSSTTQSLMVLHHPNQLEAFENHTYQVYRAQGRPEQAGYSDFGFGVWKPDDQSPYEDSRAHDTTGIAAWGGTRTLMTTLMMHNQLEPASLMYNAYSEANRGGPIDSMLDCIEQGGGTLAHNLTRLTQGSDVATTTTDHSNILSNSKKTTPSCGVITDILELKIRPGPAGLIFVPIFPAHEPDVFVGFATTTLHWQEVLTNVVPDYVNGLTCVVSTATRSYTYQIRAGEPMLMGDGDLHDPAYTKYGRSTILNEMETNTQASAVYTLTVYPTQEMFDAFSTNSPVAVALGFFGAIAGCTLIFFFYDFLMRREHYQRKEILEIKRRFVRFISHEIRTPLNTVCMGLELLESELCPYRSPSSKNVRSSSRTLYGLDSNSSHIQKLSDVDLGNQDSKDNVALMEAVPLQPGDVKVVAEDVDFWHNVIVDINENAYVAVSILNDLLNYDKLESGTLKLERGMVNLWDLVERTVNQFRIQAVNKKVDLKMTIVGAVSAEGGTSNNKNLEDTHHYDMEASGGCNSDTHSCFDLWNVWGDDVRLSQVIRNVLSNALKFTPVDGVIEVTISHVTDGLPNAKPIPLGEAGGCYKEVTEKQGTASLRDRAGSAMISIKDSGVGLTKDQLKQLFSEGVQFDANKLQHGGGSGLGLSIAKGIIEQHAGTIRAESEGQGKGTTFVMEIPLYQFTAEEVKQSLEARGETDAPSNTSIVHASSKGAEGEDFGTDSSAAQGQPPKEQDRHHRVLVAEDAASSRKMLTRLLERAGHRCVPASNGREAVLAIQRDMELSRKNPCHVPIDTVLMDYEMPLLNGPDACMAIRSIGYDGIILGVTGNVLLEDVEYFKEHGANDVLAKPIRFERIKTYWDRLNKSGGHLRHDGPVLEHI